MNEKNAIIWNMSNTLTSLTTLFQQTGSGLNDNLPENLAIIKALNIQLESVRSQVVIIQQELDSYGN